MIFENFINAKTGQKLHIHIYICTNIHIQFDIYETEGEGQSTSFERKM